MRVQSVFFNNYGVRNSGKGHQNKKGSNPQFKGYELNYQAMFGDYDSYCTLYKDGQALISERGGRYAPSYESAVRQAVYAIHPERYSVKIVSRNVNNKSGKVYIASPDEEIPQEMEKNYDYIVYDSMPPLPALKDFDYKFHSIYGDSTDYTAKLKAVEKFHYRMLENDCEQTYKYEMECLKNRDMLETSLKYKNKYLKKYEGQKDDARLKQELDTSLYFVNLNEKNLADSSNNLEKYFQKSVLTRKKIKFIHGLASIMDEAGDILTQKEKAATGLAKNTAEQERLMLRADMLDYKIQSKYFLISAKAQQQKLMQKKLDNYNQKEYLIESPHFNYSYYASDFKENLNSDQMKKIEQEIENYRREIAELRREESEVKSRINQITPEIAAEKQKVQELIDKAEPIYQKLKAYYEANNPF